MSRYGRQQRTKAEKRAAAITYLTYKRELTGDEIETLERSYGIPRPEGAKMVEAEKRGRVG